jgi:hypothetical protein
MAEERSGTIAPSPEKFDAATAGGVTAITKSGSVGTRPKQVVGEYPMRLTRYYQFSSSDLRSIGVAQAASIICASIGTFAFSEYLEFSKDVTLAEASKTPVPEFLDTVVSIAFWTWIVFWGIAAWAFLWQGNELRRIKAEHGEPNWRTKLGNWCKRHVTRQVS